MDPFHGCEIVENVVQTIFVEVSHRNYLVFINRLFSQRKKQDWREIKESKLTLFCFFCMQSAQFDRLTKHKKQMKSTKFFKMFQIFQKFVFVPINTIFNGFCFYFIFSYYTLHFKIKYISDENLRKM